MASLGDPIHVAFDSLHGLRSWDVPMTRLNHTPHAAAVYACTCLMINPLIVAAAPNSGLARRRKIDFADLADTPWLLPADTWTYALLAEAFRERRLAAPKVRLVTMSVQIRADLLADGECVTMFPTSVANHYGLRALQVDFPVRRVASCNRHLEEPELESGCRALYRMRPRGHEIKDQSFRKWG